MNTNMQPPARNVVLIVIDDLGWADLTCYGSSFYETPNLDRLAQRGVRFTDAYAACPVCSPSRASLLTGRYPARVGITNWIPGNPWGKLMGVPFFDALPTSEVTLAHPLADAGYRTYHVGKWHLGDPSQGHGPRDFGFEVNLGGAHLGHPPSYFSPYRNPHLADGPEGEYLTDRLTDEALSLIQKHATNATRVNEPFFMNLCHYAVHTPLQAPADLIEKYQRKAEMLDINPDDALVEGENFPCLHKRDQRVVRRTVQSHPIYAAMIENLDANIGRLLDGLEEYELADDTLVVFTSDNGGLATAESSPTCNAPLREGKGWMTDGGNRVCLIAAGAGVTTPGTSCSSPVTSPDVMPTILDAVGVASPESIESDGRSFWPVLQGSRLDSQPIFWHYPHYSNQGGSPACAVREGNFKLIEFFEDHHLELYDLSQDPAENRNLAAALPDRTYQLHKMLINWRHRIEAKIPQLNPDYEKMLAGTLPCPDGYGRVPGDD